ncbi:uncharacterized protein J4E78_003548 [Alternaria triticimaculans]|uniref:uncharacterized protein n=1 Tax=Alternaria triticimaculans TaxID=297637 RepID=UPI0020C22ABC|nr:uncharacterized protein J4E78_003548 [Alternaria triticimaculans]KAI4666081.1 hypothetical protein J4E78_003548 [Alternaria triticimaculans]
MAVHADYPGLTVEIYVDGKPLKEYEHEEEEENEPKITTRYIECRSGAEFEIRTSFKSPFIPMDIAVGSSLNGKLVHGLVVTKKNMLKTVAVQSETTWGERGSWRASKFRFSDLSIVGEDRCFAFEESLESLSAVGTISVVLKQALSHKIASKATTKKKMFREVGPVSESSMKGDVRSHTISLAPDRAIEAPIMIRPKLAEEPLVTFRFKYRSISGVTSTPRQQKSASPPFNEHDGLTNEDIIALIKHYRGNDKGLVDQNRKHLLVLLKHYVDKDNEIILIKQESAPSESNVRNKREHIDDGAVRGQGKRRKPEVIVLDD